jgi:hypothetical protein
MPNRTSGLPDGVVRCLSKKVPHCVSWTQSGEKDSTPLAMFRIRIALPFTSMIQCPGVVNLLLPKHIPGRPAQLTSDHDLNFDKKKTTP